MTLPSFREFFRGVYGNEPFPWQERLAEQVLDKGWNAFPLLDLPTGTGKTSVLDIALYAVACSPERMPRRTVLVVDRRIVVDEGANRARALLRKLAAAEEGPVQAIAIALRALSNAGASDAPFAVSVMRGGMPRDDDWARSPEVPVLGLSTVDQVGSRLLFRGYGISSRSASIHAGLLGNDTLILLDEVHLAEPFAQTLDGVRRYRVTTRLPERFAIVRMSATPGVTTEAFRFELQDDDRKHPVLRMRLQASKSTRLVPVKVSGSDEGRKLDTIANAAVDHARELQKGGANVVGVLLNRVDGARRAHAMLGGFPSSILVTGRMRSIDRDAVVRDLQRRAGPRDRSQEAEPFVVVSTQCLEAGADLDFDALVTECASLDALRQRFGRLDRRGILGKSFAVVLGRSDAILKDEDPIYGPALKHTWDWLHSKAKDDIVDFGLDALPSATDPALLAPRPNAPALLPAHIDAWAQTSPRPDFDPDIGVWLHGPDKPGAEVQIVFRADLDLEAGVRVAVERLLAARPSSLEALTLPIAAARRWLAGSSVSTIADIVGGDAESDLELRDAGACVGLRWRGEDSEWVTAKDVRPGDILVVPATRGGLHDGSFDPDSRTPVTDVGDLAALRGRAIAQLRLGVHQIQVWGLPLEHASNVPVPLAEETAGELRERVRDWMRKTPEQLPSKSLATKAEWLAFRSAFVDTPARITRTLDGAVVLTVRLDSRAHCVEVADAISEDDDSSFIGQDVSLQTHSEDVRTVVRGYARSLRLSDEISSDLQLAAWLHDVGKADERFQRWLVGGSEAATAALAEPLAKSRFPDASPAERRAAQRQAGYPVGYRHEFLSLLMTRDNREALAPAHDVDLVLHLIASHHGFARPFAPFEDHLEDLAVSLEHGSVRLEGRTRHQLAKLGSDVPVRFLRVQERYGWWGLAWLEAILRLADHRASKARGEGSAP